MLRVVFYQHCVVKFGFACRVVRVWVLVRLRQCVRCVFTMSLALSHVGCCVAVGVQGCSTWLHIALRDSLPCDCFFFSLQHLGQSRVAVAFPVFDGGSTVKNRTC